MDYEKFLTLARKFALDRDWDKMIGKNRSQRQTLYEHTFTALDIATMLCKSMEKRANLTEYEIISILSSSLLHDCGKETEEFQNYIRGDLSKGVVYDTNPELAHKLSGEFLNVLEIDNPGLKTDIVSGILLHMLPERTSLSILKQVINHQHENDRWSFLKDIVITADQLASTPDIDGALKKLEKSFTNVYFHITHYQIQTRSFVYASLLHKACDAVYCRMGWQPILTFPNGSVYVSPDELSEPTIEDIELETVQIFQNITELENVSNLVVGNSAIFALLLPDFLEIGRMKQYLIQASTNARPGSFLRKKKSDRKAKVAMYLALKNGVKKYNPTDAEVAHHSARMNNAYSEFVMLRFFREFCSVFLNNGEVSEDSKENYSKLLGVEKAEITLEHVKNYETDKVLGEGAFSKIHSEVASFKPANNMLAVDYFWGSHQPQLPSEEFTVENLVDYTTRVELLADILTGISEKIWESLSGDWKEKLSTASKAKVIAHEIMDEVVFPSEYIDPRIEAGNQLKAVESSKTMIMTRSDNTSASLICPNCNRSFSNGGRVANSELFDTPHKYTNREVRGKTGCGAIRVCDKCFYERYLYRLMAGNGRLLVIQPRPPAGNNYAPIVAKKIREVLLKIQTILPLLNNRNMAKGSFRSKEQIVNILAEIGKELELSPEDWSNCISKGTTDVDADKFIEDTVMYLFGLEEWDTEFLNEACGTEYVDKQDLIQQVKNGNVGDAMEFRQIYESLKHHRNDYVLSSPNLFITEWPEALFKDSNETNEIFKEIILSMIVSSKLSVRATIMGREEFTALDMSVESDSPVSFENKVSVEQGLYKMISNYYRNMNLPVPDKGDIPLNMITPLADAFLAILELVPFTPFLYSFSIHTFLTYKNMGGILEHMEEKLGHALPKEVMEKVVALEPFFESPNGLTKVCQTGTSYLKNYYGARKTNTLRLPINDLLSPLNDAFQLNEFPVAIILNDKKLMEINTLVSNHQKRSPDKIVKILDYVRTSIFYELRKKAYGYE